MPEVKEEVKTLKDGLSAWAEKNGVKITDFAFEMDYSYQHAWNLIRGESPFTAEAFGRFVLAYGIANAQEVMDLAGYHASVSTLPHPADATPVPVVTVEQ